MAYKALVGFLRELTQTVARGVLLGSWRLGLTVILVVCAVDFGVVRVVLQAGVECLRLLWAGGLICVD